MAGERLAQKAVSALAVYLAANLPESLRDIEEERSLTTDSLLDPVAYVKAVLPADPRSPLVSIYDQSGDAIQRGSGYRVWNIPCVVEVGYTGDADYEASESFMRDYMSALIRCIEDNENLSGAVNAALVTAYRPDAEARGNKVRYSYSILVDVHVGDEA